MFYQKEKEQYLRLGDILRGFIISNPKIKEPIHKHTQAYSYNINIDIPKFTVVLTPCCSIRTKTLLLTSLIELDKGFFLNPYFVEDFTRINRVIEPQNRYPPEEWEQLIDEKKIEELIEGKQYAFFHYFIYNEHDYFSTYTKRKHQTSYYMIDFRKIFSINCTDLKIKKSGKIPDNIFEAKILQLSVNARNDLRNKLVNYFGRIPDEDKLQLD